MILFLASGTFIYYAFSGEPVQSALMIAVSVLVIACPCSLGLATPLAILVYTTRLSSKGILVKSANVVEPVCALNSVLLDKTGTLTKGDQALKTTIPIGMNS